MLRSLQGTTPSLRTDAPADIPRRPAAGVAPRVSRPDRFNLEAQIVRHRCMRCVREYPHRFQSFCECGGMIDVFYDANRVLLHDSPDPLRRFFDLLPIEDPRHLISMRMEYRS